MNTMTSTRTTRLTRIAVIAWLLLLTVATAVFGVAFARLQQQLHSSASDSAVEALHARITPLEIFTSEVQRKPVALTLSDFRPLREQWDQRLNQLEQAQQATASRSDLDTLRARMEAWEHTRKTTTRPRALTVRAQAATTRTTVAAVPGFTPLGIESRGGERFLAIAPQGSTSLNQVRLLAVGEAQERWQLQAMEGRSALFLVDQQMRRLPLPQE